MKNKILTRGQFLKLVGWGGAGFLVTIVLRSLWQNNQLGKLPAVPKGKQLLTFNFEVITVNSRGEEINRQTKQAKYMSVDLGNGITLEMVGIPGGKFLMGSPATGITGIDSFDNERPQHEVTVAPFYMGKYEVTQAQWEAVMGNNPSDFKGANNPVENVTWDECVEFCEKLTQKMGLTFRLPSEAEWEYACRAGTTTPFYFGETLTSKLANYNPTYIYADEPPGEYREKTTPVGSFPPNAFGLYDMHGNVMEWCQDNWHGNYRGAPNDGSAWTEGESIYMHTYVIRGGCWKYSQSYCRSASRPHYTFTRDVIPCGGFRVVCAVGRNL